MSNNNTDKDISSLVDQLKDNTLINNQVEKNGDQFDLDKDQLEEFVISNSGKLISQSLEVMDNVKDYIMASGDPDSISSLADLINASSKSIESLNKIVIQNKRSATTIAAKEMDISSKHAIEDKRNENALIGTREEIFKKILDQAKVIDVKDEDDKDEQEKPSSDQ